MLDIKTIAKYKKTLNIKRLCDASGINYTTFHKKMHRYLKNHNRGEITVKESEKFSEGLKKLKIKFLS